MSGDFGVRLTNAVSGASLHTDAGVWEVHVFGVSRLRGDWFLHTAAIGPRTQTLTIRIEKGRAPDATADIVVATIRDWLVAHHGSEHAFVTLRAQ